MFSLSYLTTGLVLMGCLLAIAGVSWWALRRKLETGGLNSGASFGNQQPETTGAYGATISAGPSTPPEHVTVLAHSLKEAREALRATYGKTNVSGVHAVDD